MHNPYNAKLSLLAVSFVTVNSLSACNSNPSNITRENNATTVNSRSLTQESSVNSSSQTPEDSSNASPEIITNPAPPPT